MFWNLESLNNLFLLLGIAVKPTWCSLLVQRNFPQDVGNSPFWLVVPNVRLRRIKTFAATVPERLVSAKQEFCHPSNFNPPSPVVMPGVAFLINLLIYYPQFLIAKWQSCLVACRALVTAWRSTVSTLLPRHSFPPTSVIFLAVSTTDFLPNPTGGANREHPRIKEISQIREKDVIV